MSDWRRGYYADTGYTYGFYRETMPIWLQWASALQHHILPRNEFRYLDAGCGQGLNLIIAAASHPNCEFFGIDFFPEHIAHAKRLAKLGGLSNIHFIEGDFVELSKNTDRLGEFDYVISHGISSWIDPLVRQSLFQLIQKTLKPGGIFYNSYNTHPGWLNMVPFQHLVRLLSKNVNGQESVDQARSITSNIIKSAPIFEERLPGQLLRIEQMENQERAYLVQEYNNQFWRPVFFTDMVDELSSHKFNYIGSSTLTEIGYSFLPESIQELVKKEIDMLKIEQIIDYAILKAFRRDLYVKGRLKPWKYEREEYLGSFSLSINELAEPPSDEKTYPVKVGSLSFNINGTFFLQLLEIIARNKGNVLISELMRHEKYIEQKEKMLFAISYLINQGLVDIHDAETKELRTAQVMNSALIKEVFKGAPYNHFILPITGTAANNSPLDWFFLHCVDQKIDPNDWIERGEDQFKRRGTNLLKHNEPVSDPVIARKILIDHKVGFDKKLNYYTKMGAVPDL